MPKGAGFALMAAVLGAAEALGLVCADVYAFGRAGLRWLGEGCQKHFGLL